MVLKKKLILFLILLPSIAFNFFTLTIIDHNHNLSLFSSITIIILNLINISFGIIYLKYNLKVFFSLLLYCFVILILSDFTLGKVLNRNSIIDDDKILGWSLKPNINLNLVQRTMKVKNYPVKFTTSQVKGFREFGNLESRSKKVLVIGDSYSASPFSSNDKMYYNIIKKKFEENKIFFEWFVLGSPGYGTSQQLILLKRYWEKIKPDLVIYQFCVNDFFDNSIKISKFSTSPNQYFRRPYIKNKDVIKVDGFFAKLYRFFYRHSFMFKKLDNIYSYQKFKKHGKFTQTLPENWIKESVLNTNQLFEQIRNIIGNETLLFSINCVDDRNIELSSSWEKMIKGINGYPISLPTKELTKLKKDDIDVMNIDGGHLNDYGNLIYGKITAQEILKIIKDDKN